MGTTFGKILNDRMGTMIEKEGNTGRASRVKAKQYLVAAKTMCTHYVRSSKEGKTLGKRRTVSF